MELHLRWWSTVATGCSSAQSTDYSLHRQQASTQSVSSNQQSSNTNVEAVSAPKTTSYWLQLHHLHPSTGGSVKAQFLLMVVLKALGTIVMPESGGNLTQLTGGYRGLGQTKESWGTGSVASQTKGMINYANAVTVH